MAAESETFRTRGNDSFNSSRLPGRPLPGIIDDIKESLEWYDRACSVSNVSNTQKSSALKNAAKASWRLGGILKKEYTPVGDSDLYQYYSRALEYFRKALLISADCQDEDWKSALRYNFDRCFDDVIKTLEIARYDENVPSLQFCLLTVVSCYIQKGTEAMENKDYQKAIDFFKDCNLPMEELHVQRHSTDHMHEAVAKLYKELRKKCNVAEARMLLNMGINRYENMIQNGELDINCMYDTMDRFNAAVTKSKEDDLELEAIANSYLGLVYQKALNHKVRAMEHFTRCMNFVEMLQIGDSFESQVWYQVCCRGLEECREVSTLPDENTAMIREARAKYSDPEFLHYVTSTFPSRTRKVQIPPLSELETMDKRGWTRFMPKIIFAYHPDKQTGQDENWREVCEEISKGLNGILDVKRRN